MELRFRDQGATDDGGTDAVTHEAVFDQLGNQRRRYVFHYLEQRDGGPVYLTELADRVAAWENETAVDALTEDERNRVRTALHQFHLPKMDDGGFVDYDETRRIVERGEAAAEVTVYLDVVPGRTVPWGVYYLLFALGAGAIFLGTQVWGVPVEASPTVLTAAIVAALGLSALLHTYVSYAQLRHGSSDEPPGVTQS